jgi:hypothetical protein
MGKTIKALLKSGDDGRLLGAIETAVMEKWGPGVEDGMSPEVRIFSLVDCAYGSASNGGIRAFLDESLNDFNETIAAFETIGLMESADYLRRVLAVFPEGSIPEEGPSEAQKEFLDRGGCKIFPVDVVPELAAWVRARSKAFVDLPEIELVQQLYTPAPILKPPPPDAGSEDMALFLHSRGVTLTCAELRYENGIPQLLFPRNELPEGPITLLEARFAYDQRDNPDTLARLSRWIGRGTLEEIHFENCRLGTADLGLLSSFPSLRDLNLRGARFPAEGLRSLAAADSIEELNLSGVSFADDDLRPLALLPKLCTMDLGSTRVQGRTLALFAGLQHLDLASPLEDRSLSFLDRLDHLTSLNLYGGPLSPEAVARIAARPRLETLALRNSGLEESALTPLRGHPALQSLYFQGMMMTAPSAELFASMPRLEKISIGDVQKPKEMLARLRELRPSIETRG